MNELPFDVLRKTEIDVTPAAIIIPAHITFERERERKGGVGCLHHSQK